MAAATLPLSDIVNVVVQVSPVAPATPQFNQGLIVGPSAVIPSVGANSRIRQYSTLAQLLADGFTTSSPEYIAAQIYFGQSPSAQFLWVGRQDLTSMAAIAVHSGAAGTGYHVGDVVGITEIGGSGGSAIINTIGGGGAVTSISIAVVNGLLADGTGYTVSTGNATTGGNGTGLQIDITAVGETPLVAVQQCRAANFSWYACMVTDAVKADHQAIAAFVQSATPPSFYLFGTSDSDVPTSVTTDIFSLLKAASYNRVLGIYSTTQGGTAPNNIYVAAAAMGVMMGLNTGLANSYFTMMFKTLVGITAEPLTQNQLNTIAGTPGTGTGKNGNVYTTFGSAFTFSLQGVMPNGNFADLTLNTDMLASDIQFSVMGLLTSNPSIPQTDPGETLLMHQVNLAAQRATVRGFIGPGTWNGVQILKLQPGTSLSAGYLTQADTYANQSQSDHSQRKAMPIYLALIAAGAVQSLLVGVYVQN